MGTDSRERMVRSAAYLFRERGYSGTGFRDVIAHSGAPRGSIYHHFPDGKAQLAEEAVRYAGEFLNAGILAATEGGDAASAVDAFVGWWRQVLIKSEFRAGCPIVAVTVESHDDAPQLASAAAAAFDRWQDTLATGLGNAGVPDDRAARLARLIVAAVEGATILCRAHRDVAPLDDVVAELKEMTRNAVEDD
ncbi:TetR/AcrR family transcriptional regulator [Actinomadura nitritigenes]|jgi:AcrR family transcriptional regulator|uniref:TetR/AcrR family transcriptional regulator n=1 Tax=Actinomadura TaxID=1988 RepID=UPI0016850F64|nr:TetR/AcrR family transcriptional regulator [Actinomadura sp. RB99]MBD2900740.1 putative HTH-type transcriptional regulator [Actinomadura sp. RB99]